MLTLVGLGLRDTDLSEAAADAIADADVAYAEFYTNAIDYDLDAVEDRTGTGITVLDRDAVEQKDQVVTAAQDRDVAFLVSGDPLTATTHQDILFRAQEQGIATDVVHAPSILTAVTETGLSSYKFGRVTTLPEPYNGTVPDSPFDVVDRNQEQGLHTLLLLDIGMTVDTALELAGDQLPKPLIACSQLGTPDRTIAYGSVAALQSCTFAVPAALIVPGTLSDNEADRVQQFAVDG